MTKQEVKNLEENKLYWENEAKLLNEAGSLGDKQGVSSSIIEVLTEEKRDEKS